VEIASDKQEAFEQSTTGVPIGCIGTVIEGTDFVINGMDGQPIIQATIDRLKESWQGTFRW
jgi:hypothetical protein